MLNFDVIIAGHTQRTELARNGLRTGLLQSYIKLNKGQVKIEKETEKVWAKRGWGAIR